MASAASSSRSSASRLLICASWHCTWRKCAARNENAQRRLKVHSDETNDEELGTRGGPRAGNEQESTVKHSVWGTSIRFTTVTALLLGLVYPLLMTGLAKVLFPRQ